MPSCLRWEEQNMTIDNRKWFCLQLLLWLVDYDGATSVDYYFFVSCLYCSPGPRPYGILPSQCVRCCQLSYFAHHNQLVTIIIEDKIIFPKRTHTSYSIEAEQHRVPVFLFCPSFLTVDKDTCRYNPVL
jgi:hypothetical protein